MSKFFCNGADAECSCPILCADCESADWTGGTEIKTNADHIRSMTDEELAEFMSQAVLQQCPCPTKDCEPLCNDCILNWLKQPYKEDT